MLDEVEGRGVDAGRRSGKRGRCGSKEWDTGKRGRCGTKEREEV
jgi:hypothetical protein